MDLRGERYTVYGSRREPSMPASAASVSLRAAVFAQICGVVILRVRQLAVERM